MCCDRLASVGADAKPDLRVQILNDAQRSSSFPQRHRGIPASWKKMVKGSGTGVPYVLVLGDLWRPSSSSWRFPFSSPTQVLGWRYSDEIPQVIG